MKEFTNCTAHFYFWIKGPGSIIWPKRLTGTHLGKIERAIINTRYTYKRLNTPVIVFCTNWLKAILLPGKCEDIAVTIWVTNLVNARPGTMSRSMPPAARASSLSSLSPGCLVICPLLFIFGFLCWSSIFPIKYSIVLSPGCLNKFRWLFYILSRLPVASVERSGFYLIPHLVRGREARSSVSLIRTMSMHRPPL